MPEMAHDWLNKSILFYSILYFRSQVRLEEVCVGGPKLNYHTPGLAAVCVWGPIWDVPWTFLLICFEKLVLCSRNSRVRHFFKTENMKGKCTEKNAVTSYNSG